MISPFSTHFLVEAIESSRPLRESAYRSRIFWMLYFHRMISICIWVHCTVLIVSNWTVQFPNWISDRSFMIYESLFQKIAKVILLCWSHLSQLILVGAMESSQAGRESGLKHRSKIFWVLCFHRMVISWQSSWRTLIHVKAHIMEFRYPRLSRVGMNLINTARISSMQLACLSGISTLK